MRRVFLFAGIFLTVAPLGGTESLKINVSPAQAIAPANLRIRVTVQPNAMNRPSALPPSPKTTFAAARSHSKAIKALAR